MTAETDHHAPTPSGAAATWSAAQVNGIAHQRGWELPVIGAADFQPIRQDEVVWDMWQLADRHGATVSIDGRSLWFFLAAPREGDHDARHGKARIRLTSFGPDGWRDHGAAFPEGFTPGSREWSGSALLHEDGASLTMHFTAAGRRGAPTFEQRLFASSGRLNLGQGEPRVEGWSAPVETVIADGRTYQRADQAAPVNDRIKGFRDPGFFRDPADTREYLLFTASAAWSDDVNDGVIGMARREGDRWAACPPLLDAVGINSELERPHIVPHEGRYYLFWSTQAKRFAADAANGVTGLYAMVAERMGGPWRPVNGTGLVAGNPHGEPHQAYCWWVTGELEVASFVDLPGLAGVAPDALPRPVGTRFGGAPAPFFRLEINGDRIAIA